MWINTKKMNLIREFVQGIFAGISIAGKTRSDVLGDSEYKFNWDSQVEVIVYYQEQDEEWKVMAYQCNDYSQFFGNESETIDLGENWK
jgi:hypothetical protein